MVFATRGWFVRRSPWFLVAAVVTLSVIGRPLVAQQTVAAAESRPAPELTSLLEKRVTASVDGVRLSRALDVLAQRSGVQIVYKGQAIDSVSGPITLHVVNTTLGAALDHVLAGTDLRVVLIPETGIGVVRGARHPVVDGGIRGVVTDAASKAPIADAVVSVDGAKTAVRTDAHGAFQIEGLAPGAHRVTVRRLGYQVYATSVTVKDDGTVVLTIALTSVGTRLQEVVTTATGDQERLTVANDVGTINADSLVQNTLVRNVSDLLTAHTPGVQVTATSGAVGAPSKIRVRGVTSAQLNNDPIVIVDGMRINAQTTANSILYYGASLPQSQVNTGRTTMGTGAGVTFAPSPLDQIDPNSIESIDVLKGPTATALYGPDASTGVIVIKTKRGQAGPWRYHLGSDYGWITSPKNYPLLWTGWGSPPGGGASGPNCPLVLSNYGNTQLNGGCVLDSVTAFNPMNDPRMTTLGTGYNRSVVADASGGGPTVQGFVQTDYSDALGQQKLSAVEERRLMTMRSSPVPSWMKRPNAQQNIHVTSKLDTHFRPNFDMGATAQATYQNTRNDGSGLTEQSFDGVYGPSDTLGFLPGENLGTKSTSSSKRGLGQANARFQPVNWLVLTGTGGLDYSLRDDENLRSPEDCTPGLSDCTSPYASYHSATRTEVLVPSFTTGATFTYAPTTWLSAHTAFGEQYSRTQSYTMGVSAYGLAFGQDLITGAATPMTPTEATDETASAGWYAEQQMGFNQRLFVTASFRRDASSSFGRSASTPTFPKYGVSWVISDEPFFPRQGVLTQLRLRTAYGESGKQGAQTDVLRNFLYTSGIADGGTVPILLMNGVGNSHLEPQRDKELEGGFDLSLYNDRATLELTWYHKQSNNSIISVPLPGSYGAPLPVQSANVGDVRNVGTEAQLSIRPIDTRQLTWTFSLTASANHNLLLRRNALINLPDNSGGVIKAGYPLFGIWQNPVVSYDDVNGDGILELSEIAFGDSAVFVGSTDPKGSFNYANSFSLLNGRLTFNSLFSQVNGLATVLRPASPRAAVDKTVGLAEQAAYLQAVGTGTTYGYAGQVSYVSLAELSASYTLPDAWARRFRARAMTVTVAGRNLGLWTNYRGADPMVNTSSLGTGGLGDGSIDDGTGISQPKNWTLRFNLQL
jgi:TonB-linked SusC/RagA family outer membrane protein